MIKKMLKNQKGQGLAEYALIIALVVVGAAVTLQAMGGDIRTILTAISVELTGAAGGGGGG